MDGTEQGMTMASTKSINQVAQAEGDTSANEVRRIADREASVKRAWRTIAWETSESDCTAEKIANVTGLAIGYVRTICERNGLGLAA